MRSQTSARVRALLSLGLLHGFGSTGTYAYYTDTAVLSSGGFTSGTMDLQFDTNGGVGTGTAYAKTSMTWNGLVPGERKAFNLDVENVGNPPMTYTATATRGTTPAWTYVGAPITVQLFTGSAVPDTTYPQVDSCTGSSLGPAVAVDATTKGVSTAAQDLAAGATQSLCVVVGFDSAATSENQGKTGSVTLNFTATQKTS